MKSLILFVALLSGFASVGNAQTEDKNTILQIAQGDKLVLKKDLHIPANTERLYFGLEMDSGYKMAGCALVLTPSQKSRVIPQGGQLMFSGLSQQSNAKNEFKNINYIYTANMMNSESVVALECYGNSFQSSFQDLYVGGMKNKLKNDFDFVPADPEITT
ncbi:MAG: hypothetical protein EBQ92_10205 [Proteobacteria bacterium]|nr:hypothetical protein [Pseudomonadota bacterium]